MKKFTLISLFIILGNFGVPGSALLLAFLFPERTHRWFFASFVIFHSLERVWETFYTTRERHRHEFHGDWPLALVTLSYLALCFFCIFEFFLSKVQVRFSMTLLGFLFYACAFRLRWWGMKALGSQWSIHAVGAIKLRKYRLLRIGPYKYIRHPVYLGIILEEIGLPLMANAFYALLFSLTLCVPLVVVRAIFEEKSNVRKFGPGYAQCQKEVGMFLPTQFLRQDYSKCP